MISAQIVDGDRWPDQSAAHLIYTLTTDAPYSPDVADDLARRVVKMRAEDRAETKTLYEREDQT